MGRMSDLDITRQENLQTVAEFGHVFTVTPAGAVVDGPADVYAPEYYEDTTADQLRAAGWETCSDGYTGQYGYRGPHMHASEYLGGRLARDILETPGTYVVVVVDVLPDGEDEDPDPAGWAVLRHRTIGAPVSVRWFRETRVGQLAGEPYAGTVRGTSYVAVRFADTGETVPDVDVRVLSDLETVEGA